MIVMYVEIHLTLRLQVIGKWKVESENQKAENVRPA